MDPKERARPYTTDDGVTLWMIPYTTPLVKRIALAVQAALGSQAYHAMNVYALCAGLTVAVDLPAEDPPAWGVIIKEFIADKSFFLHPIERGFELEQVAPVDLFEKWFKAYNETRPVELMATPELQDPSRGDGEDGAEDPTNADGAS
jgi:hypothetical protein